MIRVALGIYHLASRVLLPKALRDDFEEELLATVAARLAAARGPLGPWPVLVRELGDLTATAVRERGGREQAGGGDSTGKPTEGRTRVTGIWSDVRTSVRNLSRRPGLALGVTLTIGLGIGVTTTIYSVVDTVLLRPLPFADAGRLVAIGGGAGLRPAADPATGLQELVPLSSDLYASYRERVRSLDAVAAVGPARLVIADTDGVREQVPAARVSPEFFQMLGVAPALGRVFLAEEHSIPAAPVAVITHDYWQRRYGGDPAVLGRTLETPPSPEAPQSTIVGILPRSYRPPEALFVSGEEPGVYMPLPLAESGQHVRMLFSVYGLGRLAPSATLAEARAEAATIAAEADAELGGPPTAGDGRRGIGLNDLHAQTVGATGRTLWVFLGAAGLLLLLTAMNAASLFLARALDRRQELAVRLALGAGRRRVVRLLAGEAALLSAAGGVLGVLLAYGGVATFLRLAPASIPRLSAVAVDGRVLTAAALATLLTALVAGLLPALRLTKVGAWEHIQSGGRSISEPGSRLRTALVGGQMALAVVLLCGAGLLFSSFMRIRGADPGFEPDGLVALTPAALGPLRFTSDEVGTAWQRWDPILEALRAVPGVEAVAGTSVPPFQAPTWAPRILLPEDAPEVVREGIAGYAVSPGYLETMGMEVVSGRGLAASDGPDGEAVALVNEAFVRTQLGGRDPLGIVFRREVASPFRSEGMQDVRIVGVVRDVVQTRTEDGPRPAVYFPYGQADFQQVVTFVTMVRTRLPLDAVVPEVRRVLATHERIPQGVVTMNERASLSRATPRFQTSLVGAFALIAMLLAAVGLHGSLAHSVRRRQRELGVRMALGADRGRVLTMVLGQGVRVALVGLALGLAATLALARVLSAFLYEMEPYDPRTLLAVSVVLLAVSVVACLVPARRATAIDPVRVLNAE